MLPIETELIERIVKECDDEPPKKKMRPPLCFCYTCKYEVLCTPFDLPRNKKRPKEFVPELDEEEKWCYCYKCKYEVLCAPWDLPKGKKGPVEFVPVEDEN